MILFMKGLCAVVALVVVFVFYKRMSNHDYINTEVNLNVTSSAFEDGGMMPKKYNNFSES